MRQLTAVPSAIAPGDQRNTIETTTTAKTTYHIRLYLGEAVEARGLEEQVGCE